MLEIKKPKSWLKSVSAFANGVGGVLIFGIADNDSVVGVDDAKKAMEVISEQIKTKMDPIPEVLLKAHEIDGKKIITCLLYTSTADCTIICRRKAYNLLIRAF